MVRILYILFLLTWTTIACVAQPPTRLPKVVVKDTALSEPSPLDTADKTRITSKDLEQMQAVTLVDALRRVPGVYVTQDGGIGQRANVSLRGASTGQTSVILDGMHINDVSADNGAVDLAPWLVDDLSEIQVIRGPLSSLYGSDAIGGVIILETKKGKGPGKIYGKTEGGSFSTYQQVMGVRGQKELIDYHVTASRIQSNGSPRTPDRFRGRLIGKPDEPLHQDNISARFGVGNDSTHLSLFTRYVNRRLGFRSGHPIRIDPWRQNMTESFNRLQGHFEALEGKWVHEVGLVHYRNDRENENTSGIKDGENIGSQSQLDWQQKVKVHERVQAQIATELVEERFYTSRLNSASNQAKSRHGGLGGAVSFVIADPFTLSTAARIDKFQGLPVVSTYRIGGEYRLYEYTFKGGIGTGFKAPTLSQRFYRSSGFVGNPNLKPEKSLGWDLGVDRSFFHRRVNVAITVFQNRIHDLITYTGRTTVNLKRAQTQGFEALAKFQLTQDWGTELTHTYTQAWDVSTKAKLVRRPANKTTFRIIGQLTPAWQVSGNVLYVGPQVDNDSHNYPRSINMPSYEVFGAETSYQLTDQWQVYGRGENILNRRYENPDGYQQSGLGVYVGIRAQC
jgi:vitamin B12 transporter